MANAQNDIDSLAAMTVALPDKASKPKIVDIFIDLPPHASMLRIDGREFHHGFSYKIPAVQEPTFRDIMDKAWRHEREVSGQRKPYDTYRRPA
jgi:hypothetical protein